MKSMAKPILILSVFLFALLSSPVLGVIEYYVSPTGDDANPGTVEFPFASMGQAKLAVRGLVAAGLTDDVVVYLRQGAYSLDSTLKFTEADSGTSDYSITYKACLGEEVHINGGREIPSSWFTPLDDPKYNSRVAVAEPNMIYVADLRAHEITNYGKLLNRGTPWDGQISAMELFVNYQPMQLGRWPNASYESTSLKTNSFYSGQKQLTDRQFVYYREYEINEDDTEYHGFNRPDRWTKANNALIHGYFDSYQRDIIVPFTIQNFNSDFYLITLPYNSGVSMSWAKDENYVINNDVLPVFYFLNLLEEIDQPGEWYLDRNTGKLFLYPPDDMTTAVCHVSMIETMLQFEKARYINFEGLILEICRDVLVDIQDGESIRFYRCTLRNAGTDGAAIEGHNCGLTSCAIYNNGDGGVTFKGGDRKSLTQGNNYLTNSHIHDLSRWGHNSNPAVFMSESCGMSATFNVIDRLPGSAIVSSNCNSNIIGYNAIYDVCGETDDNGAILLDRYWTSRGTNIYHNFLYNIARSPVNDEEDHWDNWPFSTPYMFAWWMKGNHGIFLENGASGNSINGNILYNIQRYGIYVNGGRDNDIDNNILAYCEDYSAVYLNRLYFCDAYADDLNQAIETLSSFDYQNPPWSNQYPELVNILTDDPNEPKYNTLTRNIGYENYEFAYEGCSCDEEAPETDFLIQSDNLEGVDPCFVDEPNLNMNLLPKSPANLIPGWQEIPFDTIGTMPFIEKLTITLLDCQTVEVRGSCPPWAQINDVIASTPDVDISDCNYIDVLDNGAIYGRIPRDKFGQTQASLYLTLVDPQGNVSQQYLSNQLKFASLKNSTAWPESINVQINDLIDIALPIPEPDVTLTLSGLPDSAIIDDDGHLFWPTASEDAQDLNYVAVIMMEKNGFLDCGSIMIHVSDTPSAPTLDLSVLDCSHYVLSGQCQPWATLSSATIIESGQNIADLITIDSQGQISGQIATPDDPNVTSTTAVIYLSGPTGQISPAGTSNTLVPAMLVNPWDWPASISANADDIIMEYIPAKLSSGSGVTYHMSGASGDATIDDQGHFIWPTTVADRGEHVIMLIIRYGDKYECHTIPAKITDIPDAPSLSLSMQNSDYYLVTGVCKPWAEVYSVEVIETGQKFRTALTVHDDGTLTGQIPKLPILSDAVTIRVVLAGPSGAISESAVSNMFTYTELVGFFNWPKDMTVKARELIEIAGPMTTQAPISALTFYATGLGAGATVDPTTGNITWPTTAQDAGEYAVQLSATNGVSHESGKFTITITPDDIQEIHITKCTVRAKGARGDGRDSIEAKGTFSIQATELLTASSLYFGISSGQQPYIETTLPLSPSSLVNGKYIYQGGNLGINTLELDLYKGEFSVQVRDTDLTGFRSPIRFELEIGNYHGIGYAFDNINFMESNGELVDVVNGNKTLPIELLSGHTDALQLDTAAFKSGAQFNTLNVKGGIALANPNISLKDSDLTICFNDYAVVIPKDYWKQNGKKKIYTFKAPRTSQHPVASAQFNLEKGTFRLSLKDKDMPKIYGNVQFGISLGSFDEKINTVVTSRSIIQ